MGTTYRIKTTVSDDGIIVIKRLPFQSGEKVEIIIRTQKLQQKQNNRYPLRGKAIRYIDPFESVAQEDWDAIK